MCYRGRYLPLIIYDIVTPYGLSWHSTKSFNINHLRYHFIPLSIGLPWQSRAFASKMKYTAHVTTHSTYFDHMAFLYSLVLPTFCPIFKRLNILNYPTVNVNVSKISLNLAFGFKTHVFLRRNIILHAPQKRKNQPTYTLLTAIQATSVTHSLDHSLNI